MWSIFIERSLRVFIYRDSYFLWSTGTGTQLCLEVMFFPIKVDLFNFKLLNQAKNIPVVQPSYPINIKIKLKWKLKSIKGFRNPALPENSVFFHKSRPSQL